MSAPVRAVIFDLGHTVWDFNPSEASWRLKIIACHERLLRDPGDAVPAPADLERAIAETVQATYDGWREDREHLQDPSDDMVRAALAKTGTDAGERTIADLTEVLFGEDVEMPVVPSDSVAALGLLEQGGIAMGCITNTMTSQAGIENVLQRLGLLRYMRSVVTSTAMRRRKPHPSLFQRALEELDIAPEHALYIGDRLYEDIQGPHGIGMRGVLTHQFRREEVDGASVRPAAVIRRLAELPDLLERL